MTVSNRGGVDAAVVGGGISGLFAATRLIEAGLTCAVLESRDRVGGRLLTHHSPVGHFDLGATWFFPGESRVGALIEELDISTHAQHIAGDAMYHVRGGAQRLDGNPIDVVSGRFTHGAATLTERLATRLGDALSLRTPVHEIHQHEDDLQVHSPHGSLTARHVILALPPSLAVHHITVRPGLPDRLQALAAATPVWMGNVAKAVVVYPEAFWRHEGLAGAAISHLGPLRELHDMSGPDGDPAVLFGFAPLAPGVPTPPEHAVVAQLVEIFGPRAAARTRSFSKTGDRTSTPCRRTQRRRRQWEPTATVGTRSRPATAASTGPRPRPHRPPPATSKAPSWRQSGPLPPSPATPA